MSLNSILCCWSGYSTHSVLLLCSHLNAFDGLVDRLEQGSVLWVLIALLICEHVGQRIHVCVKILLSDGLLLW